MAFPEGGTELSRATPDMKDDDDDDDGEEEEEEEEEEDLVILSFSRRASFSATIPPKLCPTMIGGLCPSDISISTTAKTSSA